jgi:hypothetical protein
MRGLLPSGAGHVLLRRGLLHGIHEVLRRRVRRLLLLKLAFFPPIDKYDFRFVSMTLVALLCNQRQQQ